jgi:hypothetical protein
MGKKLLSIAATILVVLWVVHNPTGAAGAVNNFVHAVSAFVSAL